MSEEEKKARANIRIVAVVDADGDYDVGKDEREATERFDDNIGGILPRQSWQFDIDVPLPTPSKVSASIEGESGTYSLEVTGDRAGNDPGW